MVRFGQIVVGPPGSGKTTFCLGMSQYLKAIGRDAAVINLDPANHGEGVPFTPDVDIEDLVSLEKVMQEYDLGPNGAMLYCLEYLENNVDWLLEKLEALGQKYLLFDFPGQVELFTHCPCVQNVVQRLQREDYRLTAVHLVDAYHCSNASMFISAALLSLMVMLRLELPHINVLSKIDLIEQMGPLPFNLEFFTECQDMRQLLAYLDAPPDVGEDAEAHHLNRDGAESDERQDRETEGPRRSSGSVSAAAALAPSQAGGKRERFKKLTEEICDVVDSYSLVSFYPLNIQDAETVGRVLAQIDKCNGYILGAHDTAPPGEVGGSGISDLFRTAFSDTNEPMFEKVGSIQERYMPGSYGGFPADASAMDGSGARVGMRTTEAMDSRTEAPDD